MIQLMIRLLSMPQDGKDFGLARSALNNRYFNDTKVLKQYLELFNRINANYVSKLFII